LDERARHQWIALNVLPFESQARRWLSRYVRSLAPSDIDDLVQEAYSRIWMAELTPIQNARAYFFQVLRNLLTEHARRAQVVPMERLGEIDELRIVSDEPGPDRMVSARQELERLFRLVAALPGQCRRAFELRKLLGHSQREVAIEMGISERTVEKHLAKALDRVLQGMARDQALEKPQDGSPRMEMRGKRTELD
jgi:RNA polymerase sigma-70 factor (ECF subfamily)